MKKREFIRQASLMAVLASFGLTLEDCMQQPTLPTPSANSNTEIDLTKSPFSVLKTAGSWLLHPTMNILLVNVGGTISAFSSVCPHAGCSRNWEFRNGDFVCICHYSVFNSSGGVVSGPTRQSLTRISVTRNGDILKLG